MIAQTLREFLCLAALALIPALVSGAIQLQWRTPEPLRQGQVRYETARLWGDAVLWVDSRPAEKFEAGHLPGALRLTDAEWETLTPAFLDAWDPEKTIVVYGAAGTDTAESVAHRLREELQLDNVWSLQEPFESIPAP